MGWRGMRDALGVNLQDRIGMELRGVMWRGDKEERGKGYCARFDRLCKSSYLMSRSIKVP